jgi:catechol 2,3-dioxygenase
VFQIVHGDAQGEASVVKDKPMRITHVVLNSHAVDDTQKFLSEVLGFTLADRTVAIAFHELQQRPPFAGDRRRGQRRAEPHRLRHARCDSVMRGGGRMKDAGFAIQWGPGRHGPGNNLFNYFIDPFGVVIEYTAEVQQVDDSYVARGPADWKWPPGRVDQWGISPPPGPP